MCVIYKVEFILNSCTEIPIVPNTIKTDRFACV